MSNHFYDLAEFSRSHIDDLLRLANELKQHPDARALEGKVMALLFLNPSLRTLTSFQASMTRLGGGTFVVSPEMSIHRIETRAGIVMDGTAAEHIRDAVPVIASYADVIGIRAMAVGKKLESDLADDTFRDLMDLCEIPVINLESAFRHPCQALGDWKTLDDRAIPGSNGKLVFNWVYHPEPLPLAVPADIVQMAVMRGMDVTLLRPDGFSLPESLAQRTRQAALASGGSFTETDDREQALAGAHVVYAGSWGSTRHYGDRVEDRKARDQFESWCVDERWFEPAPAECVFMHSLPVRRGVEVDDRVLDGKRSIVVKQAQNRMYAQMAVLKHLLR